MLTSGVNRKNGALRAGARVRRCPRKVPSLRSGQSDECGCNAMHVSHPHLQTHWTQFASGRGILHNSCCQRLTWSSWSFGGPPWPPAADARPPTADPRSPGFVCFLCILPRPLPRGLGPPSPRPGPAFLLDVLSPSSGPATWGPPSPARCFSMGADRGRWVGPRGWPQPPCRI